MEEVRKKGMSVIGWNEIKGEKKEGLRMIEDKGKVWYRGEEV